MKKIKKILVFLLSLIIVFSIFPTTVFAKEQNGDKLCVSYNNNGSWSYNFGSFPYLVNDKSAAVDTYVTVSVYSPALKVEVGDIVNFKLVLSNGKSNRYTSFDWITLEALYYEVAPDSINETAADNYKLYHGVNYSNSTFSYSFESEYEGYLTFALNFGDPVVDKTKYPTLYIDFTSCTYSNETSSASVSNKLSAWFENLFGWLKDIRDNGLNLGDRLGNWFSDLKNNIKTFFDGLGDRISGFFTKLGDDIKARFTELKNNLSAFFTDVGNWFSGLGDSISGFFEKLWNRIYWGNENGASEYEKPTINNKLNDIIDTLNGYQIQLKETISTIGNSAEQVSTYLETGTSFVNGIINVAGVGFTALIVFGIVFVLVRKVVGR